MQTSHHFRLQGLIAASFTPFQKDGSVNTSVIPDYAAFLKERGVQAVFIAGTTGEGASLSQEERECMAGAWLRCRTLPVVVHVGHTSLTDACRLARHAADNGAAAIAAIAPYFYRPGSCGELVNWCEAVASTVPELPFYYYHMPSTTGVDLPMSSFLPLAVQRIENFRGLKFSHDNISDYGSCVQCYHGDIDLVWGKDEKLFEALSVGAQAAIGTTYNYASALYFRLIDAYRKGETAIARSLQDQSIAMIDACCSLGVSHLAAAKTLMSDFDLDCGPVRLPLVNPTAHQLVALRVRLNQIGYFDDNFSNPMLSV